MQIDFLLTELQCFAAAQKRDDFKAHHAAVELAAAFQAGNGQDEVIKSFNFHVPDSFQKISGFKT
jgi:hypothetical protein